MRTPSARPPGVGLPAPRRGEGRGARARHFLLFALSAALLSGAPFVAAVDTTELANPALQARYLALTHELRCMQCQNQTIADSPVGLASDMRREVREMLLAGKSDEDVRNFMVARYGEFILFRPRFSVRNAWLWLAPGVLLVAGAIIGIRIVRQRNAMVGQDDTQVEEDSSPT
ncbi:MAG TPA: cytochrome c-type biogenesis protein [Steroidobacteraceae bacterium]|nr:cytochrome c-type biogenesis protein [Steroidobacteraceae bacterium]